MKVEITQKPSPVQFTIGTAPPGSLVKMGSGTYALIVEKRFGPDMDRKFAVNIEHGNVYSDGENQPVTLISGKVVLD